ncbi:MAG: VTT domain-containing protein [Candidatus Vogelbacteria bacterium]|nr:VTT domain-containing protein [Candidatus Vogelbacteria bacterium]
MSIAYFIQYVSKLSYLGVAAYSGTLGYFIPIPEEAAFIVLGYLAGLGKFNFGWAFLAAVGGIFLADQFFYWIAFRESRYLLYFKKRVREEVWTRYERSMINNIGKAMIITRFLIGFRFLGPVIAGTLKIPYKKFLAYDFSIIALYVGGLMYLGFAFRRRALGLIAFIEHFHNIILWAVIALLLVALWRLAKYRESK